MKKLAMALFLLTGITTFTVAQDRPESVQATPEVKLAAETEIEMDAVPADVRNALNNTAYKTEDVTKVYELETDTEKHYKFIINDAHGKREVVFDANGTMKDDRKHEDK